MRRTISLRKDSITSRSIYDFQRKASVVSQLSKSREKKPSLSEIPSRFSIADIPIGGAFAAFSGRSAFPGPVDVLDEKHSEVEHVSWAGRQWVWLFTIRGCFVLGSPRR